MDEPFSLQSIRCRAPAFRRRAAAVLGTLIFIFCMAAPAYAAVSSAGSVSGQSRTLVPLGRAVGVKLFSDGLLVVNLSESVTEDGTASPARQCGIRTGDVLLELNDEDLKSTEQLQTALQKNGAQSVSLTVKRGARTLSLEATPESGADGVYRLGAWVRDSMAGIGTMTYYDPQTGTFGALGHGITDVDTAQLMPISSGALMYADVASVKKGHSGTPGELTGDFKPSQELSEMTCNASSGIFGTLSDISMASGEALEVARRDEVKCGNAVILSNIRGDKVEEFSIKITKIMENEGGGRDMLIRVTDQRLLSSTGGIVQGMSGSPILQNGKLVGAVTHVLVSDPTKGYAILMEHMLEAEP